MNSRYNPLVRAIKQKIGMSITTYCAEVLKTPYKSFNYRMRTGNLRIPELSRLLQDAGMTFEEYVQSMKGIEKPDKLLIAEAKIAEEGGVAPPYKEAEKTEKTDDILDMFNTR